MYSSSNLTKLIQLPQPTSLFNYKYSLVILTEHTSKYGRQSARQGKNLTTNQLLIIIIIEGLSLLQSIPPTTANKQTQAQKKRGSNYTQPFRYGPGVSTLQGAGRGLGFPILLCKHPSP